jgi:UMF1 family MFS transporter
VNPFKGLDNPREVWAWGMFDLANQSFTLLINTLLFPLFFRAVVVNDPKRDDAMWSVTVAISLAIVVLLSPIAGAIADFRAWKKAMLLGTGAVCVVLTCSLALIPSDAILIAMLLYIPANVAYQLGENFLASFLPEVANRRNMGRVSGIGWSMGYAGALLILMFTTVLMLVFGLKGTSSWRPFFVLAGVWFLLMAIPTALYLPERARSQALPQGENLLTVGFSRLRKTIGEATQFRHLTRFFIAFLVYGFGVQVVVFFSSPIAEDFGFRDIQLVIFVLQLTVVAGVTAAVTSAFQDRVGHKRTILIFLVIWFVNAASLAVMSWWASGRAGGSASMPQWPIWLIGNGLGIGLGGIGTASRSMVGACTPSHRTAEFFGLWGLVYKLAGCLGVLSFGVIKDGLGSTAALTLLASFFVVGGAILLFVSQAEGERAAEACEEQARGKSDACVKCGFDLSSVGAAARCPKCESERASG